MSVFLYVRRYSGSDPLAGEQLPISREHLETVVSRNRRFRLVEEQGAVGIRLLSDAVAVLQDSGSLSVQLGPTTDTLLLTDTLRELAEVIPDAVVEDEEGTTY